jgi:hypothetical protein
MIEKLKELRSRLTEKVFEGTVTQSDINSSFDELLEMFRHEYSTELKHASYYSHCECCGEPYESAHTSNGLCNECNVEIEQIQRKKIIKKYLQNKK